MNRALHSSDELCVGVDAAEVDRVKEENVNKESARDQGG